MPEQSKVRWSQLKVGVVALCAFAVLFVLVFLLTSSKGGVFQRNALLRTYMDDAAGLADGTAVRLNGISVGYLDKLQLTNSRDPARTVEFDMEVQKDYLPQIPVDSVVGVAASNLLGDKFLNITKGASPQHVVDGAELKPLVSQDIPELLKQMAKLLGTFQDSVTRVDNLLAGVEAGRGNLGKLLKDEELYNTINGISSEGKKLLTDIRTGNGTLTRLIYDDSLYQEARKPLQRIDAILADLQKGQGTLGKALKDPALFDEARETLAEVHKLVDDVNAGKGTAGKLMKDEQLYQRATALEEKLTGIVDKIAAGQGTVGQLLTNPQLFDSLNAATGEMHALVKDMRANPKKFLTIQLHIF
ncbi:MAG: MlaD family protein [Bryobacteraceae bacterium]|jgi:phospholipid/cholesterol/gamma-HCH transport system substrate-binding protein